METMKFIKTFPFKPQGAGGTTVCCCTPDGAFLYIGSRSVNYVKASAENPLIKAFNTKQQIVAIDVDPRWNSEGKFFATLTNENSILIWDFDKGVAVSGHKAHSAKAVEGAEKSNSAVHMSFLKNRNLLSICSNDLVVYCLASNSICVRPKFAPGKGQIVTALKCSPYNEHIFALGTNRGQVYICDLQKMAVVYTLGRHQTPVASLSWNLIDISAETPKSIKNTKPLLVSNRAVEENDDIFNIYDYDYLENEFGAPINTSATEETKNNAEANEVNLNPNFNFQEACESLKQEINALNNEKNDGAVEIKSGCDAVTLEDCRSSNNAACPSSMCDSESTEGSLELVDRSSSSDESCHVDGRDLKGRKQSFEQEREYNKIELEAETTPEKMDKETVDCAEKKDILLASASTDCQIWIWNAETGGCCDNLKGVSRKNSKGTNNVYVFWRSSTELYAIDPQGEIIQWVLSPNTSNFSDSRRTYKFERTSNFRTDLKALAFGVSKDLDFLWYISSQREIVCESIETAETILHYATTTGGIMMATESPENNSKIAFAYADRRIALLETSQLSQTRIFMRSLQVKLTNHVRALAWSDDGCNIAYGTVDGQVGYVNIDTQKHVTFHTFNGKPVYSIVWRGEVIFLTCNDNLFAYNMAFRDPLSLKGVKTAVSSVSVKHNYIFLGTPRGYIDIYRVKEVEPLSNPKTISLEQVQSVEVAKHYITEIAWNPIKKDEFAVAANEANIKILLFNLNENTASIIRVIDLNKPKCTISTVKWSNRDPNKLVTCGFDGALRVFDLSRQSKEELIFTKQFNCPLYSAMLLPRDEQYALCTGRSISVEIVDTGCSENMKHSQKNEGTLDHIKWATKMNIGITATGNKKKDKAAAKKVTPQTENILANDLTEKIAELAIDQTNETLDKQEAQQNSSNFLKIPQTLMHLITKEHNKNPLERLLKLLNPKSPNERDSEPVLVSKLFGSKKDVEKVLCAELEKVKTQTTVAEIGISFLAQVKGDVRDVILKAIQSRQLNESHIALSPTVSYSFWQKCCRAYAEQLLEQGYGLQAATYMLRIHNQREAINMLISAKFFKEALLIARVYLVENDPLVAEITNKWIEQLENYGNLAGAALVCAVSKQYMRGYEILSKQRAIGPDEAIVINLLKEKATA